MHQKVDCARIFTDKDRNLIVADAADLRFFQSPMRRAPKYGRPMPKNPRTIDFLVHRNRTERHCDEGRLKLPVRNLPMRGAGGEQNSMAQKNYGSEIDPRYTQSI